jgi:hypothetical protein
VLRAVDLPPTGGDTCWTDLEAAYLALSPQLRQLADQLEAVHDGRKDFEEYLNVRLSGEGNLWEGERVRSLDPVTHPVVRVHPETGRRSLFVNPGFTTHIKDVTETESRALLDIFFAVIGRPEHSVRHRWSPRRRPCLGQPRHGALRGRRLRRPAPGHAPDHHPGRPAGGAAPLTSVSGWTAVRCRPWRTSTTWSGSWTTRCSS